ncbi:DUF5133 domain-containing protein [Streptomyces goshikiensis]|uniref:DUF5133 domain-containing protein n=1 Tax=Streptomyces goshikiensis TaxID=1942 RepID=UPI003720DDAF
MATAAGTGPRESAEAVLVAHRRHVNHLCAARRRALAAPDDVGVRGELEEAAYALCVVMGQRSVYGALLAAEEMIAASRLEPLMPAADTTLDGAHPSLRG